MALGARRTDALKLVLGEGLGLAFAGVTIGLAGSLVLTRVMSALLLEVSATDPSTFVAIALVLLATSSIACYVPSLRATRVDPMVALRYE